MTTAKKTVAKAVAKTEVPPEVVLPPTEEEAPPVVQKAKPAPKPAKVAKPPEPRLPRGSI